jgi:hypothetical protein
MKQRKEAERKKTKEELDRESKSLNVKRKKLDAAESSKKMEESQRGLEESQRGLQKKEIKAAESSKKIKELQQEIQEKELKVAELNEKMEELNGEIEELDQDVEEAESQRTYSDLNPYIQNIIMVDGVNDEAGESTFCIKQMENLRMLILSHFMTTLPCVAIGTLRQGKDGWKDSACLVQKNVPVLYIDVRRRPPDLESEAKELKKKVQQKKEKEKRKNNVEISEEQKALNCSEPKKENQPNLKAAEEPTNTALKHDNELPEEQRALSCLDAKKKDQHGWYAAKKYIDTALEYGDKLPEEQSALTYSKAAKDLIAAAREYCDQEWEWLACHERYDVLDACRIAFWHSICERANNLRNLSSVDVKLQVSDDDILIYKAIEFAKTKTEAVSIYDDIKQAKDPCHKPKDQVNF